MKLAKALEALVERHGFAFKPETDNFEPCLSRAWPTHRDDALRLEVFLTGRARRRMGIAPYELRLSTSGDESAGEAAPSAETAAIVSMAVAYVVAPPAHFGVPPIGVRTNAAALDVIRGRYFARVEQALVEVDLHAERGGLLAAVPFGAGVLVGVHGPAEALDVVRGWLSMRLRWHGEVVGGGHIFLL